MPKLPNLSGKELAKILCNRFGFKHARTTGSHLILIKQNPRKICVPVPNHDELAKGTLLSIIKEAGLTREDLLNEN